MTDSKNAIDQGFNDAELEDIMNEIESLERDFDMMSDGEDSPEEAKVDPIMEEMTETLAEVDEIVAEETPVEEVAPELVAEEAEELLENNMVAEMDPMDAALESALAAELEELTSSEGDLHVESTQVDKTVLQGVIDQEVDELLKEREFDELGDSPISEAEAEAITMEPNVVEMAKPAPTPFAAETDFEPIAEVAPVAPSAPAETEMSFSMSGSATIKLNFKISGQSIDLRVSEGEGFVIEMGSGAKFTVPIHKADSWKKAS